MGIGDLHPVGDIVLLGHSLPAHPFSATMLGLIGAGVEALDIAVLAEGYDHLFVRFNVLPAPHA